jgi:peptide/nickel transport system permease protein
VPAAAVPDALGDAGVPGKSPGLWALAWRRLRRDRVAMVSLAVVAIFVAVMLASWLGLVARSWSAEVGVSYAPPAFLAGEVAAPQGASAAGDAEAAGAPRGASVDISDVDPLAPRYAEWRERAERIERVQSQPAATLPFGGDKWGRDVLQKTIKGSEVSITVGLVAVLLGAAFGAAAGYWGGLVDDVFEWFYNVFTSIPYILLILAFAAVLSRGLVTIILILGFTGWTGVYRLMRAEYLKHAGREYVRAAQAIGASHLSRMFRHILPNTGHVVLVQFSQHVVQFIKAEVILSFLGMGVPVSMVSWGTMLAEAQEELVIGKWWQLAAAGLTMAVLVTAVSLLTDAMRDALDPKLR